MTLARLERAIIEKIHEATRLNLEGLYSNEEYLQIVQQITEEGQEDITLLKCLRGKYGEDNK